MAEPSTSSLPPAAADAAAAAVRAAIEKSQQPGPTATETEAKEGATEGAGEGPEGDKEPQTTTVQPGLVDPNHDVTVFADQANFTVKHPLYSPWTMWFDSASKQDKAKSWDEALVKVIAFESVEEFWGLYNNIVPPSLIHPNSNYYLFKEGIKPAWEDSANSKGGKWSVQLPRGKYSETIDNFWLYTMLAAIGETFETPFIKPTPEDPLPSATPTSSFSNEITGVIVSSRKAFYRINIWTRTSNPGDEERIKNIGKHFKYGVLGLEEGLKISERDKVSSDVEFVSHKDSQAKYGTKVDKWTV
ncbi:translation initiation factor eIF 4e-like domain-containing protein [Leucosporidium creatinivorum]|uniref:Eukaryotic translation initiation factor 4E n=1 Tax=Leucosporidium creatinivorum TaxID=106004 RepID=A0A1Y2F2D1_9BASI|nr:translation initiation factor eIF 4e-like domain-containing protein [Leucosporidium creatinivorum]